MQSLSKMTMKRRIGKVSDQWRQERLDDLKTDRMIAKVIVEYYTEQLKFLETTIKALENTSLDLDH